MIQFLSCAHASVWSVQFVRKKTLYKQVLKAKRISHVRLHGYRSLHAVVNFTHTAPQHHFTTAPAKLRRFIDEVYLLLAL